MLNELTAADLWIVGWALIGLAAIIAVLVNLPWFASLPLSLAIVGVVALITGAILDGQPKHQRRRVKHL